MKTKVMAFKIPEQFRLTSDNAKSWNYLSKEFLNLTTEAFDRGDGYFWLPRVNAKGETFDKSAFFFCRATLVEGWRVVAVSVPPAIRSQRRSPTWEELHWVKSFFWDEDAVVMMYHPGKATYCGQGNHFWLHLWFPEQVEQPLKGIPVPPIFEAKYPFRKLSAAGRIIRAIKNEFKIFRMAKSMKVK